MAASAIQNEPFAWVHIAELCIEMRVNDLLSVKLVDTATFNVVLQRCSILQTNGYRNGDVPSFVIAHPGRNIITRSCVVIEP